MPECIRYIWDPVVRSDALQVREVSKSLRRRLLGVPMQQREVKETEVDV